MVRKPTIILDSLPIMSAIGTTSGAFTFNMNTVCISGVSLLFTGGES